MFIKLWTWPNIGSDSWALASSLAGAVSSAGIIGYVTFRVYGRQAAFWAVGLFCALPTFAWAAGNLRMYGLMPGIAVACWYANREFLRDGRWPWAVGLIILQLIQTYTHAIGFFFAAFFALAALIEQWRHSDKRRLQLWVAAQAISLAGMLPVVASALIRGTEPLGQPTLLSLLRYPAQLLLPWGTSGSVLVLSGAAFLLFLALGLINKSSRIPTLIIPCGALLACVLVSSLGKTMFKPPVFTANLVPFLVMGAAAGISNLQLKPLRLISLIFIIAISLYTTLWVQEKRIDGPFQPTARYLLDNAKAGDIVVIPNVGVFWGIMRYAAGPNWGHPLDTMPLQSKEAWTKLKAKLGPEWVERLGLNPASDYIEHMQVKYIIGNAAQHHFSDSTRAWIVHRDNFKETVELGIPSRVQQVSWFSELSVTLALPGQAGIASIANPSRNPPLLSNPQVVQR